MTDQEKVTAVFGDAVLQRPRPLVPGWGEVIGGGKVLASGSNLESELWAMAAADLAPNFPVTAAR